MGTAYVLPTSALVEGTGALALPLGGAALDLDVLGREQEDLAGDPLDGAAQAERQAGGEVHQALGVGVVHVGEVDDDRDPAAEGLPDVLGLVVGARVDGGDAVE